VSDQGGCSKNERLFVVMCRKPELPEMNPEERDARTVVCMQLASRIQSEDLQEFFSSVGKVVFLVIVKNVKYYYLSCCYR